MVIRLSTNIPTFDQPGMIALGITSLLPVRKTMNTNSELKLVLSSSVQTNVTSVPDQHDGENVSFNFTS